MNEEEGRWERKSTKRNIAKLTVRGTSNFSQAERQQKFSFPKINESLAFKWLNSHSKGLRSEHRTRDVFFSMDLA